jgi:hypothetical protein
MVLVVETVADRPEEDEVEELGWEGGEVWSGWHCVVGESWFRRERV